MKHYVKIVYVTIRSATRGCKLSQGRRGRKNKRPRSGWRPECGPGLETVVFDSSQAGKVPHRNIAS